MDQAEFERLKARLRAGNVREGARGATKRLASEHRAGHTGALAWAPEARQVPAVVAQDDDMPFARRAERQVEAEADHRARRQRADAERASRERLHRTLRDAYGLDAADRMAG